MRQFILAKDFESEGTGASGKLTIIEAVSGTNVGLNLVLQRTDAEGGNILYPFYPKDLTWTVAENESAQMKKTAFNATFTVPEVTPGNIYSVIFVKKGQHFNKRANWSFEVRSNNTDTATTIAEKIVKFAEDNKKALGLTVTNEGANVTVAGPANGQDYKVVLGSELFGTKVTTTQGKEAFMDAEMIKDLAAKCAADAGFEYTYDEFEGMYPAYPLNPLAQPDSADPGYKVYTLRFTEPRLVGTREEAVYQIIQIAFPKTATLTGFEAKLDEYVVDVR